MNIRAAVLKSVALLCPCIRRNSSSNLDYSENTTDDWSSTEFLRITGLLNLQKSSKNSSAAQEFMLWCFVTIFFKWKEKKSKKKEFYLQLELLKQTKLSEVQEHFLQRSRQSCKINIWVCQPFAIQHWPFKKLPLSPSTSTSAEGLYLLLLPCTNFQFTFPRLWAPFPHKTWVICVRFNLFKNKEENSQRATGSFKLF